MQASDQIASQEGVARLADQATAARRRGALDEATALLSQAFKRNRSSEFRVRLLSKLAYLRVAQGKTIEALVIAEGNVKDALLLDRVCLLEALSDQAAIANYCEAWDLAAETSRAVLSETDDGRLVWFNQVNFAAAWAGGASTVTEAEALQARDTLPPPQNALERASIAWLLAAFERRTGDEAKALKFYAEAAEEYRAGGFEALFCAVTLDACRSLLRLGRWKDIYTMSGQLWNFMGRHPALRRHMVQVQDLTIREALTEHVLRRATRDASLSA